MLFRKTLAFLAFVMPTAAIISASAPAMADEWRRQTEGDAGYKPIQSIAYEFGSKAMSGYFVAQGSACLVTLMISDKIDPDRPSPATAARVRLVLQPGQVAGLDSEEGRSLNLTCGDGAKSLVVGAGGRGRSLWRNKAPRSRTQLPIGFRRDAELARDPRKCSLQRKAAGRWAATGGAFRRRRALVRSGLAWSVLLCVACLNADAAAQEAAVPGQALSDH